MEWFTEINAYHWIALGLVLFAAEALGAAGFLLGTAAAALVVGLLALLIPSLGLVPQLILFALVAVAASYLYLKVFTAEQADRPDHLNHRAEHLIGTEFELTRALMNGEGRVQIGDTFWRASADTSLDEGTRVRVIAADAMRLKLEPV